MNLYVYCPRMSNGALELVKALNARRLRRFDGANFWNKRRPTEVQPGDVIICWGTSVPELDGVRVLNGLDDRINKLKEIGKFLDAGVPTVQVYTEVAKPRPELLPRIANHTGGKDLLVTPDVPDYYVIKENFISEYRIHSFAGRSIRAGIKIPREGFTPVTLAEWKMGANLLHPWVRSYDGGWKVNYDGFQSTTQLRKLAHMAVKALGLTFGAVDIGQVQGGGFKVLEVNSAPGIEGNSIASYVRAINKWIAGKEVKNDARRARTNSQEDDIL